ncbi:cystin-1 isoform X1 [Ictidomys tridecemlineatus]
MGSGSSRSGRTLRLQRSPDSHPARPGQAAPEGGAATATAAEALGAGATAAQEAAGQDPGPAATPDGREETLRLLDQLLAESAAWGPQEPVPRGAARPRPAAGARSAVSPEPQAEDHPEDSPTSEHWLPAQPEVSVGVKGMMKTEKQARLTTSGCRGRRIQRSLGRGFQLGFQGTPWGQCGH